MGPDVGKNKPNETFIKFIAKKAELIDVLDSRNEIPLKMSRTLTGF
jgi:hypothetical protein